MKIVLIVLGILILFFVTVMIIDCHRFVVRSYTIESEKINKSRRIVLLSDLHGKSYGKGNERLIQKIDSLNPEMVFICGDMYTCIKNEDTGNARALIDALSEKYKIYYSLGNHEQKTKECPNSFDSMYPDYIDFLNRKGVVLLDNNAVAFEELKIYGLTLPFKYYRKFKRMNPSKEELNELLGTADEGFNILLAHNPLYFDAYADWGASLVMAGHVHGGLMRLPIFGGFISPNLTVFPKYSGGLYEKGDSKMVLSCGLGTHHLPIRIFNPGEISLINLKEMK